MLGQLIAELGMDDTYEDILNYSLTAIYAIDKRHKEPFRYFKTGPRLNTTSSGSCS